ncbi:MAG: FAD-binding oxidoreductase [Candidatus Dormibacteria bacterium]
MLEPPVLRHLERQVGAAHLYTRPADLAAYAYDASGASGERRLPEAVIFPASTEEVSQIVQVCAANHLPVVPRGAGTGYVAGAVAVHGGVILNLSRMSRVVGIDAEADRLHAEAGAITAHVQRSADAAGRYYPVDPGAASTSTIGGNVATNAAGPRALRYGSTANFLVAATVVIADGRIHHLGEGGEASSLLPLLNASEGTLAVITEVILRLLPAPAGRVTLAATFADLEHACSAVALISDARIVPAALELLDAAALRAIAETGIAVVPNAAAFLLVEVEGDNTDAQSDSVRATLEAAGATTVRVAADRAEAGRLWALRKAVSAAVAKVIVGKVNEDVVVPRDRVNELLQHCQRIGDKHHVPVVTFGHLGDGNLHISFLIDPRLPGERARGDAAATDLFEVVLQMGGSLSGEHGVGTAKLAYVERQLGSAGVALMRGIKAHYDPGGLLNPGVKIPGAALPTAAPETAGVH